jgi:hypothetical protein
MLARGAEPLQAESNALGANAVPVPTGWVSSGDSEQAVAVVAHDPTDGCVVELRARQRVEVVERLDEALGVRVVGSEQHAVSAALVDDVGDVVFPERVDVDVAPEDLDWVLGEFLGHLAPRGIELVLQVTDPVGTVLDLSTRRRGDRDSAPSQIIAATASSISRCCSRSFNGLGLNALSLLPGPRVS